MPRIEVPLNVGRVRVAVTIGNKWTVWNGKQGKDEFSIACRDRKQAQRLAELINTKGREKMVEYE